MKAFYYENNGYNGILIANEDGKWISYDEIIDGIQITRENIGRIAKNFREYDYNNNDFQNAYELQLSNLIYGEDAQAALDEQDYYEEIYQNEEGGIKMNSYECTDKFEKVVRALNALTDRELMRYDTAPESATEEELETIWGEYRAESHIFQTALIILHKICDAEAGGIQKNYKHELANLLNYTHRMRQQAKGGYKEGYTKALHMLSGAYLIEIRN